MRILLVGHSLLSPWTSYTHRALKRLGHSVKRLYCTSLLLDRLTLPSRCAEAPGGASSSPSRCAEAPGAASLKLLSRDVPQRGASLRKETSAAAELLRNAWHRQRDDRLLKTTRRFRPDLTLILWGNTLSPELLRSLKTATRSPLVTWWVDDPFRHHVEPLIPLYDFFFIFDRSYAAPLKQRGAPEVRFLPCACDETVYYPRRLTAWERARYASDVALVAWYYPDRARIVQALAGFDVKIWGREWPPSPQVRDSFVKDAVAAKIYSAAKLGLNIHSDQTRQGGLNTRAFELPASGTFQMIDAVTGIEELLEPGREVAVYRSPEEAREMTQHYLKHEKERIAIAGRGRQRVLAQHTYVHRMRTLLQEVGIKG